MTDDELTEKVALAMHTAYEAAAADSGWETQEASRVPWDKVPEANKAAMSASARAAIAAVREADMRPSWADRDDDLTESIEATHPFVTQDWDRYHRAMDLVGNRHSKSSLVALVAYFLQFVPKDHTHD